MSERTYKVNVAEVERLMNEQGMSEEALAGKAAIHVKTLRKWLKGQPAFKKNVKALSDALGTQPRLLIARADNGDGWPSRYGETPAEALTEEGMVDSMLAKWPTIILGAQHKRIGGFNVFADRHPIILQTWTTAQCLACLLCLPGIARHSDELISAFDYMERDRINEGVEGWSYFTEPRGRTITEIAAWVVVALAKSLRIGLWPDKDRDRITARIRRDVDIILTRQATNGGWCPINVVRINNARTYSTIMTLWALAEASIHLREIMLTDRILDGVDWLMRAFDGQRGWMIATPRKYQAAKQNQYGITSQTLCTLSWLESLGMMEGFKKHPALQAAKNMVLRDAEILKNKGFSDIDRTHQLAWHLEDAPEFLLEASSFLWCPWTIAAAHAATLDTQLTNVQKGTATALRKYLINKLYQHEVNVGLGDDGTFEFAESLLCLLETLKTNNKLLP